jgi:hypothetical protein
MRGRLRIWLLALGVVVGYGHGIAHVVRHHHGDGHCHHRSP